MAYEQQDEGYNIRSVERTTEASSLGRVDDASAIEIHLSARVGESPIDLEIENEVLSSLLKSYGEMVPVAIAFERANKIISNKLPEASASETNFRLKSERIQRGFVRRVLNDRLSVSYPPLSAYSVRFAKHYYSMIESENVEVIEEFLDVYLGLLMREGTMSSLKNRRFAEVDGHLVFRLKERTDRIIIKVSSEMTNVGLVMWEAGYLLSEFIIYHPELFDNKRCLELGSGVGLSGIALSLFAKPTSVVFTDYSDPVLDNIEANLLINDLCERTNLPIYVCDLDWEEVKTEEDLDRFGDVDVLIAADVVYDVSVVQHLARVIRLFLSKKPSDTNATPVAYIVTTVRNPLTWEAFGAALDEEKLIREDVSPQYLPSTPQLFYYNRTDNIVITKLSL
eukprot:TRINITY_DN7409_c0_g1_i2.p1 TRINITY_DN7409_c0_g1~~TRINITY_DN7409_c0_g1_i2.p1  ORF type:complete len:395 (+),score=76.01 TRINITY_DN7409_c0_g1_i2:208-1392(+)